MAWRQCERRRTNLSWIVVLQALVVTITTAAFSPQGTVRAQPYAAHLSGWHGQHGTAAGPASTATASSASAAASADPAAAAVAADLALHMRSLASSSVDFESEAHRALQEGGVQLFPAHAVEALAAQQAAEQAKRAAAGQQPASLQKVGVANRAGAGALPAVNKLDAGPHLSFSAQQQQEAQAELLRASHLDAQHPGHAATSAGAKGADTGDQEVLVLPSEYSLAKQKAGLERADTRTHQPSSLTGVGMPQSMDADPNEAVDIFPRPKSGRAEGSATSDHSRASASPVAKQKQRQQHGSQGHPNWDMSVFPAVHVRGQIKAGALGQGRNQSEFAPGREGNFPPFVEGEFASGNPLFAETTHRCLGSMYTHRVCHYYNLYLWNDTIYYVTTDAGTLARGVPPVAMSWVAQPDSFAALQFGGDEAMWLEVIHPDDLPFDWQEQQKLVAEEVLAWKLTFQDNYGHLLGEHGPTLHAVLCSYMGRCQYSKADLEDLHILLVHEDDGEMDIIPAAGLEMIRCFSKHSMRLTNDPIFDNKVLVINHMMAGIGPECRGFPWCRASYGRNPLPAHLVVSWKEYLSQCIGLPSDLVAPVSHPNVVIVNRPYQVGRGFLNIQEAVQLLKANISSNAAISVHELDETSLVEQAKIYQNASVLVQMHGAALGNIIFLPRGACVIDIVPQNNEDKHPWVFFMAHDLQPLQYNPIALPPQKTVLMLHKIKHSMAWRLLPPHWRARILEDGVCPATNRDVNYQFDAYAACNFQWFLKNGNVLLDVAQLVEAVELAFKHIAMFEPRSKDLNYQFRSSRFAIGDA